MYDSQLNIIGLTYIYIYIYHLFLSDEGPMLETLDYTIRIGSTPTFLYFDLYLYSAYAAHFVYISPSLVPMQVLIICNKAVSGATVIIGGYNRTRLAEMFIIQHIMLIF